MTTPRVLPDWAEDLRRRYLRGEASMFLLHGNVFDAVVDGSALLTLTDFLANVLLRDTRDTIALMNVSTGVRFTKRAPTVTGIEDLILASGKDKTLAALERLLIQSQKAAVVLEYAETLVPTGDPSFQGDADRAAIVTLHRWSFLPEIERGDNVVILVAENLTDLAPKLVSNPKVATIQVPMPDLATRKRVVRLADPRLSDKDVDRYAETTAGLKAIQISSILAPHPSGEDEGTSRKAFIAGLLGGGAAVEDRAAKLAALTAGLSHEEIKTLVAPGAAAPAPAQDPADSARREIDRLVSKRKREILERECFGLVEFVEPAHGFDVVGGMDEVKKDLLVIAESIREGRTSRVPMGLLFTGPMGTGKTFVAEAFARECGLPTIKLKNFRSKWVGATEGNLEKILNVIKAIGQVVVIIDEGDRAFGSGDGESDGGTSSRVIARIKEFMSDTTNRGRILFVVMTNRPDKLDVDLKRAGRLDRKIPFLYSQTAEEVEKVAAALIRKNHLKCDVDLPALREGFSAKLVGYSNADVEAVLLMANDDAAREQGSDTTVGSGHLTRAASDYFPSRDVELLEYMELMAVFEASSRRLLPPEYSSLTPEDIDKRLRHLRVTVGNRR